jgi:uncharacterized FAD-dependent dehydrogenase
VLTEFVGRRARAEILYVSKPHIGTFKLVGMVEAMRAEIEALGGEIRFGARVEDARDRDGQCAACVLADGEALPPPRRAGGRPQRPRHLPHAAARGVHIEAKPFSIGLRIEHPQSLIDRARFGKFAGHPLLGAADYKLVHHCRNGRSVYSFCMCPGGTVVAATSEPGRVVTNGMSQYSRNERNANAGIVVGITPADYPGIRSPASTSSATGNVGVRTRRRWRLLAPAQRVGDFLAGRASTDARFGAAVLHARRALADLRTCLPDYAIAAMREALPAFGRQIRGFAMDGRGAHRRRDAHLIADPHHPRRRPNTRASTPAACIRPAKARLCAGGILVRGHRRHRSGPGRLLWRFASVAMPGSSAAAMAWPRAAANASSAARP